MNQKHDLPHVSASDAESTHTSADPASPPIAGPPRRIGPYVLIRLIGQGGMGAVYEAQQDNPRRTVALKIIRSGSASASALKRFDQEAHLLGRLQHPGIAQVFEAGMADTGHGSQPFFAMELIRGRTLLDYAAGKKLGTRERLELFARIADAVQHAHTKGIIHRDLKPGNILVDEAGQPKILDFGVARATDSDLQVTTLHTDVGVLIGTLPYMSPEQVTGDPDELDTRSDVYALGIILFELLAGRLPYDVRSKVIHEAVRIIREEEPTRLSLVPSTTTGIATRDLRGDIETIVGKALEKDKTRRYQTANALAADIRHYLSDEPIAARPPSTWYQALKFAKRNKVLVGGVATTIIVLIGATAVTSTYYFRSQRDAQSAFLEANNARATLRVLERAFQSQSFGGLGRDVRLRDVLSAARTAVREMQDSDPLVAARSLSILCETELSYGERSDAEADIREAIQILNRTGKANNPESASAETTLAAVLTDSGRMEEAREIVERAIPRLRAGFPATRIELAEALNVVSQICFSRDLLVDAEIASREVFKLADVPSPEMTIELAAAHAGLGALRSKQSRLEDAEAEYRQSLALFEKAAGPFHVNTLAVQSNLAYVLHARGRPGDANLLFDDSIRKARAQFGDSPVLADVLMASAIRSLELAGSNQQVQDWERARRQFEEALVIAQNKFGDDSPYTAMIKNSLCNCLQGSSRAASLLRSAVPVLRRAWGESNGVTQVAMYNLANNAAKMNPYGDLAEAERTLRDLRDILQKHPPASKVTLDEVIVLLGFIVAERVRLEELTADDEVERAVRECVAAPPEIAPFRETRKLHLANVLARRGKLNEAEQICDEIAVQVAADVSNLGFWAFAVHTRALVLIEQSRFQAADSLLKDLEDQLRAVSNCLDRMPMELLIRTRIAYWSRLNQVHPDRGNDATAEWRAKLVEFQASTQPTSQPAQSSAPAASP